MIDSINQEEISSASMLKRKLNDIEKIDEAMDIFLNTQYGVVLNYVNALENAEKYIELTMRDSHLLNIASTYREQIVTLHGVIALLHKEVTINDLLRMEL
jgi:hypothetical protein